MDKGIYTALSGGIAMSHEIELIANNLANANTPGFKRDTGTFNEYLTELRRNDSVEGLQRDINAATIADGRPAGDKSFVEMDGIYTDYNQGMHKSTGRALDVAIQGPGMLEVLTPSGIRYTRQGNLSISADGRLVTSNGFSVLSKSTDPNMAPEARVIRLGPSPIIVTPEGGIMQNGATVATLGVQEFHENQWLEKMGNSYFRNTDPKNLKPAGNGTQLRQGSLEGSNVNAVSEMTRLIEATRTYESHMQAIKTYQAIDGKSVTDIVKGF
jgi:flagellar basal-body rod protein FlgF